MIKRSWIFAVLAFVFLTVNVSAVDCGDDQTIMRLYDSENSHVSAWNKNTGTYTEEVCYDEIFGVTYGGANPHDCNGINRVLSLYSDSNSHASKTTDANYNYEVCYGNLHCTYDVSPGNSCYNGGEVVARMYDSSNSHVSSPDNLLYPIKVCCIAGDGYYWKDMDGNDINETDFGDTVKMVALGVGSGPFEIMEDDGVPFGIGDDAIRTVQGISEGFIFTGNWTITSEDLDKTTDYEEFYFNINGENSDYLAIDTEGEDDPTIVSIVFPPCGTYYDESETIPIVVDASDGDDLIIGKVTVNGDDVSFSNGGVSFNKTLDVPGNLQIVAEAFNTRGGKTRAISNVMVLDKEAGNYVDGEYVAACITKPMDYENIPGSIVEFDASATRGIRVVGGVVDELVPLDGDVFSWYWRFFGPGREYPARNLINTTDPIAFLFTAEFPVAGDNSASLRVEI